MRFCLSGSPRSPPHPLLSQLNLSILSHCLVWTQIYPLLLLQESNKGRFHSSYNRYKLTCITLIFSYGKQITPTTLGASLFSSVSLRRLVDRLYKPFERKKRGFGSERSTASPVSRNQTDGQIMSEGMSDI